MLTLFCAAAASHDGQPIAMAAALHSVTANEHLQTLCGSVDAAAAGQDHSSLIEHHACVAP
jgi:hypothetical protein